jgi:hypothetical protein
MHVPCLRAGWVDRYWFGIASTLLITATRTRKCQCDTSQALLRAALGHSTLLVLRGATHDSMPADIEHVIRDQAVAWFDAELGAATGDVTSRD